MRNLLLIWAAVSAASWANEPQAATVSSAPAPADGAAIFARECSKCHGPDGKGLSEFKTPDFTDPRFQARISDERMLATIKNGKKGTLMQGFAKKLPSRAILQVAAYVRSLGTRPDTPSDTNPEAEPAYAAGDDLLFSLPTGRRLDRHGLYVNFTHRFAYDASFSGTARGAALGGLEGFSLSSFGFRYGITHRLSAAAYRSPTFIGRPIQLMLGYNFTDEEDGAPLNTVFRYSAEGHDNFSKNFSHHLEGIVSRSIGTRAQLYAVPTLSFNNRRLFAPSGFRSSAIRDVPGFNTFSVGFAGVLDIRPTFAVLAEAIPTFVNGRPLGIHRPAFAIGIQKKITRHSFTIGFTNSPGTTVAQRSGTRAAFLNNPGADTIRGLTIGFNLTRQLF